MSFAESILRKKGIRSDSIWTSRLPYRFAKRIPFALDIRALMQSQYWPQERLGKFQDARLRPIAALAARLPFWRQKFEQAGVLPETLDRDTLELLPITSKKDFLDAAPEEYISPVRGSWGDQTSGSTGRPFGFMHDPHYELRSLSICERMFRTAGKGIRYPLITIRSRWRPGVFLTNGSVFFLRGYASLRYRLKELQKQASRHPEGVVLNGFSSTFLELARLVEEQRVSLPVRAMAVAGESLSDEQKRRIERAIGAPFYMPYTTRELGWLGFECEHYRLHLNEEWAYVEIVDAEGKRRKDGEEGGVVVTTFDNETMPFIRYDSSDRGVVSSDPCPCGRTLRTMRFVGRVTDIVRLSKDRTVSLLDISASFDEFWRDVRQYQVVQTGDLTFRVRIVPGSSFESIRDTLEARLVRMLHPKTQISWEIVEHIEEGSSGKAIYFVRAMP